MTQFYGDFNTTANASNPSSLLADNNYSSFMQAVSKMHKESHQIKKPPPSPFLSPGYRKPVIIHTYSPKVIQTEAHNFMQLVQKLTGWSEADKKRKKKQKQKQQQQQQQQQKQNQNQNSVSHISSVTDSASFHNCISCKYVGAKSSKTPMDDCNNHNSYSYNNVRVSPQMRFTEDFFEKNNFCKEFYMADDSYVHSSMDAPPHLFNMSTSSQSFLNPCKQQQQPPPPPPPPAATFVTDINYLNHCQQNLRFLDNAEYNFSEILPPIFAKDFDF